MHIDTISPMTRAYLICALWSSSDNSNEQGGDPLDDNYDLEDIAPESVRQAESDCVRFKQTNEVDLVEWDDEQAGHDFWLTRNHHGAGFWDRGKGAAGRRLTTAAQQYKELHPMVGDDGQIYFEG